MRLPTILFIALFISGCALPHFPNESDLTKAETVFNSEVFSRGGKAAVVIEEHNDITSSIPLHGELIVTDLSGRDYTLDMKNISVFMLDPGTYTVKSFRLFGKDGYFSAHINYAQRYRGGFNIADGEVIYLGKINTSTIFTQKNSSNSNIRQEIVTSTAISDSLSDLPSSFLGLIQQQTGRGLTTRLIRWRDTSVTGENNAK